MKQNTLKLGILLLAALLTSSLHATITKTERGAIAETDHYRIEFKNGYLLGMFNKLTHEQYLDTNSDMNKVLPHLPSGMGTQNTETERIAAEKLYHWPWWEHRNDMYLPNQHYPDAKSKYSFENSGEAKAVLIYNGLTDGKGRFPDETFQLTLEIDIKTGDLLVTPEAKSPNPGVYSANLSLAPMAPAITAEAPITDGIRITRENTGNVLWTNQWPDYWQYGFLALNGWKKGAFAIWTQDQKLRYYKSLFYLKNDEGISFSFSMMNVPPFEKLKTAECAAPWRIQAFDNSWMQGVKRYHQWRDANVKMAPRPEFTKHISFIASIAGSQKSWLEHFLQYTKPWQNHAAAFQCSIRKQSFDHNHADNTPHDQFREDTDNWRKAGTYGMSYLQPMILWGPFPPEEKQTEREKQAIRLHQEADTRHVFQKDTNARAPYVDQHHLGHPGWQRWFLDWIKEWCHDYGAQGIYHDQSYHAPIDRRGLAIGGMTAPEGMADYFYKAATENPGTFHGTEMVTECNAVAVSNSIGSGYHWGTAPNMRLARVYNASPITAALSSPGNVLWSFVRLRGDSTWDLRERRMQEARAQIAGAIDGPLDYNVEPKWYDALANTAWHDRTRDVTFLKHGLRPYFPENYSRDVFSYFRGANGEEFRYERTPWGSQFVEIGKDGKKRFIYGVATGVQAAAVEHAGITNWLVYNNDDPTHTWKQTGPAGLHPDRWYVLNPNVKRPPVYFSTVQGCGPSFYEAYVKDSGYNGYFAFLRLRTINKLTGIVGWESLELHSPTPPKALYVNGKEVKLKRKGDSDVYAFSVKAPADIVAILKDPPAKLADLHQAALLRITEPGGHPVDYYRPDILQQQANGGVDEKKRPVIQDAAAPRFGFQFGATKYIYIPLKAPDKSEGGTMRIHIPKTEKYGRKTNHNIESLALNLQPVAMSKVNLAAKNGSLQIPQILDIPLQPGEVKLLSLKTYPIKTTTDCKRPTTRIAFEWVEDPEGKQQKK